MRYKVFEEPKHPKSKRIRFSCESCGRLVWEKPNSYSKNKHHFCDRDCRHRAMEKYKTEEERKRARYLQGQEWRKKNIERVRAWKKESNKRCRERVAHSKARYKARRKGAEGFHTIEDWNKLVSLFDGKCVMCGEKKKLTRDHIIPLSAGGTDYIDNIQPLCARCNSKKGVTICHT